MLETYGYFWAMWNISIKAKSLAHFRKYILFVCLKRQKFIGNYEKRAFSVNKYVISPLGWPFLMGHRSGAGLDQELIALIGY